MKYRSITMISFVAALLLASAPALAKDLNGRFAVGGGTTLLGSTGVQLKYHVGHLAVGLLVGYGQVSTEEQVGEANQTGDHVLSQVDTSLRVHFNAARAKATNLYVGGGFTYGSFTDKSADADVGESSWTEMGIELFLGVEHFLGNHFSLTFETGVPIHIASDDHGSAINRLWGNAPIGKGSSFRIGALSPNLAASFNFYF